MRRPPPRSKRREPAASSAALCSGSTRITPPRSRSEWEGDARTERRRARGRRISKFKRGGGGRWRGLGGGPHGCLRGRRVTGFGWNGGSRCRCSSCGSCDVRLRLREPRIQCVASSLLLITLRVKKHKTMCYVLHAFSFWNFLTYCVHFQSEISELTACISKLEFVFVWICCVHGDWIGCERIWLMRLEEKNLLFRYLKIYVDCSFCWSKDRV